MKKLLCILLLIIPFGISWAQTDSTKSKFDTELTLASRNLSRGVSYGSSPSIQMKANYTPCRYFELGTYGQATLNGIGEGYGNQLNLYAEFKYRNLSLTIDDYFYFNADDSYNNYLDYSSEKTQHFIEARAKAEASNGYLAAAFTVYQNKYLDNNSALYLEAGYDLVENVNLFIGYVTDKSDQLFYDDAGVTSVGATVSKELNVKGYSPTLKTSLVFCPNYKNIYDLPGLGHAPVYLTAALTF